MTDVLTEIREVLNKPPARIRATVGGEAKTIVLPTTMRAVSAGQLRTWVASLVRAGGPQAEPMTSDIVGEFLRTLGGIR